MRFIRPVLERQITMRDNETITPFISSCLYRDAVMEKYMAFLPEQDPLREQYQLGLLHGVVADALVDFGLI
jgi:hypothetical protein